MAGTDRGWFATHRRPLTLLSFALVLGSACQVDSPTGMSRVGDVSFAKGGSGGGGSVAPTVTSTNPSFAHQDTTIDVSVFGTGFTTGAKATWSLSGDTTKVHVKSTKVVSSTEILAKIEVPAGAPVATYDVEVTLTNGKKGVGAEMFEVLEGDPTAELHFPLDDAALGVRSDRQFVNGTASVYAEGVCGVKAKIFATEAYSNSGDLTMQTSNPSSKDRRCAAYPRTLTIVYAPGDQQSSTIFMNLREIANTTYQIPIGTTVRRALSMQEGRCDRLAWRGTLADGTDTNGADSVNVTRLTAKSWLVESQPYPFNEAYCRATGQKFNVAVRFTVVASKELP